MAQPLGIADAKRRFSELVDRVGKGERIVLARRGKPAVVLVPPSEELVQGRSTAPTGYAAIAGALADWDELDDVLRDVYAVRRKAKDRPAPALD